MQYLGQLFAKSRWQVAIFCINFSQWKSHYVENICLSSRLHLDILLVVLRGNRNQYFGLFLRETLV